MIRFVVDSSLALCWAFEDERTPESIAVLAALDQGIAEASVPQLWFYEMANVLQIAERRGRITAAENADFIAMLERLPIRAVQAADFKSISRLAQTAKDYNLTAYDASYLDLASQLPEYLLATLDKRMQNAASCRPWGT